MVKNNSDKLVEKPQKDIRLDKVNIIEGGFKRQKKDFSEATPLDIKISGMTKIVSKSEKLIVNAVIKLEGVPKGKKQPFMRIDCEFLMEYEIEAKLGERVLQNLTLGTCIPQLWPYFREYVQNATWRMGIPPLTLSEIGNIETIKAGETK